MSAVTEREPSFVDTNVFVYAVDRTEQVRRLEAQELLRTLTGANALRTSTQVLSEYFVTVTRKIRIPLTENEALERVDEIAAWPVVMTDVRLVRTACELAISARIAYWDALIVAAAARAGAKRLYSEDLSHGQRILGVDIVNPFRR